MHRRIRCLILSVFALLLTIFLCCEYSFELIFKESLMVERSGNPPAALQADDLIGIWEAEYCSKCRDRLFLREDGTFKQVYHNGWQNYIYETPWNRWWIERFPDGRVRVHLEGARYYYAGIEEGEREGLFPTISPEQYSPWGNEIRFEDYYDPFTQESVQMVKELILNVRQLPSGEIVLVHMWGGPDWGFGEGTDIFHKKSALPPTP